MPPAAIGGAPGAPRGRVRSARGRSAMSRESVPATISTQPATSRPRLRSRNAFGEPLERCSSIRVGDLEAAEVPRNVEVKSPIGPVGKRHGDLIESAFTAHQEPLRLAPILADMVADPGVLPGDSLFLRVAGDDDRPL